MRRSDSHLRHSAHGTAQDFRHGWLIVAAALLCGACTSQEEPAEAGAQGEASTGARAEGQAEIVTVVPYSMRPAVMGSSGGVSAGHPLTAAAAMEILHKGGNAFDAGVAALLTGGVVEQGLYSLGGESLILVYSRREDAVTSIVGLGWAARGASIEWYRERGRDLYGYGLDPAVVPGALHGALTVLERWGTMSFEEVAARAIEYAEAGFPLMSRTANAIYREIAFIERWPANHAYWTRPDGSLYAAGEIIRLPTLANTLKRMVAAERERRAGGGGREAGIEAARDRFYKGDIAAEMVAFLQAHGTPFVLDDFAEFHSRVEQPVSTTYKRYTVYKQSFNSQGPMLLQTLNILENFDLRRMGHNSADYLHTLVEAMKLAFADRDTYYADTDFVGVPAEGLLSKEYAARRARSIDMERASETLTAGDPFAFDPAHDREDWPYWVAGAAEAQAPETGATEARAPEAGSTVTGAAEMGASVAETGAAGMGSAQVGARATGATEAGAAEMGASMAETDAAAMGSAQMRVRETRATEAAAEAPPERLRGAAGGLRGATPLPAAGDLPATGDPPGATPIPAAETELLPSGTMKDTTHIAVIDKDGNIFDSTPSGGWIGGSVILGDTGIAMSVRGEQFWLDEARAAHLRPRSRPRYTLTPSIVLRDGEPFLAIGTPGGDSQEQTILQIFLNIVEFPSSWYPNLHRAIQAPRVQSLHYYASFWPHETGFNELNVESDLPPQVIRSLEERGHRVNRRPPLGIASCGTAVLLDPTGGARIAGADVRRDCYAMAY